MQGTSARVHPWWLWLKMTPAVLIWTQAYNGEGGRHRGSQSLLTSLAIDTFSSGCLGKKATLQPQLAFSCLFPSNSKARVNSLWLVLFRSLNWTQWITILFLSGQAGQSGHSWAWSPYLDESQKPIRQIKRGLIEIISYFSQNQGNTSILLVLQYSQERLDARSERNSDK